MLSVTSVELVGHAIVLTVGGLLPIMNPFSTAPLFVSLTAGFDAQRRKRQALMDCI
jgi:multiple antibiotic resistance protein